ncbi:hypothetical protein AVEN_180718-1 [Araneus ventricosus]|uniref:Mutator-like transposase domain-containing protein n=1 Tax=Araneus ventricosus TaxID=182803 RepID=A0A4Y2FWI7_ARAVE|nr:hypothetical protein AVEN_180718-1 [Araneus ventricosus]
MSDKRVDGFSSLFSVTCSSRKLEVSTRNSKLLSPKEKHSRNKYMSKACKGCSLWKEPRLGIASKKWHARFSQVCTKNHTGSSGKMEADGMVKLFQRSESERGVRYQNCIGDGDSNTFLSISECHSYGKNVSLSKLECIGHVQ